MKETRPLMALLTGALTVGLGFALIAQQNPAASKSPQPGAQPSPKASGNTAPLAKAKGKGNATGKGQAKGPAVPALPDPMPFLGTPAVSRDDRVQRDFPVPVRDARGTVWVAYLEHDGTADRLVLARQTAAGLETMTTLSDTPGVLHQPALAAIPDGTIWAFWGQVGGDDVMHLRARSFRGDRPGPVLSLAENGGGSDTFAHAAVSVKGRLGVVWQSLRGGEGDIYARFLDPGASDWSAEIAVASGKGGDWEPRLAFDAKGEAWVVYDSSRGNEFNVYLAQLSGDTVVATHPIGASAAYEARATLLSDQAGTGFWIAAERGRERWGLDVRGHNPNDGFNAQKRLLFGHFDTGSAVFTEIDPGAAGHALAKDLPVNLPTLGLDAKGNPWMAYRFYANLWWGIAVTHYDLSAKTWSVPRLIPESTFGQDRRSFFVPGATGQLSLVWPSDGRNTKKSLIAGVHLAALDTEAALPVVTAPPPTPVAKPGARLNPDTPERDRDDHHVWERGGKRWTLVWGDVHRHTDISNCRTGYDGCIAEHFRYAYDMAKLDFLGTSDHTDIAKIYDPYEWWHNQRMADAFHAPGRFNALYVYEREQRWPWGHRNVVFAQRGGPIVYIQRANYRNSPWQALYPVEAGLGEIEPTELWKVLRAYGKPLAIVSHTGATGMGTDWGKYDQIDATLENTVEIYQGARVSYEGIGAPQPTVGLRVKEAYTADSGGKSPAPPGPIVDFGPHAAGVYQNALSLGHKLGIFCSSDHISQHVSYGGVYVEENTREGIVAGLRERRSMAATDKIYLEFTCGGHPMGAAFESKEKPVYAVRVEGTAPLAKVTLVCNEKVRHEFTVDGSKDFSGQWTDESPAEGENRCYLRVEQTDGNMAWASPVWVRWNP